MTDQTIDARGLACPLPTLRVKKAFRELPAGATVELVATDPRTEEEVALFAKSRGHELLGIETVGSEIRIRLQKGQTER